VAQQCKALYDELETTVKQLNRNLAKVSATYKDASKAKLAAAEMSAMLIQKVLTVEMPSIKLCQELLGRGRSKCDGVVVKAHDIAKKLEKALNGVDAIAKKSDGKSKKKLEDISTSISMLICGIQGYREDSEYSLGRILRDAHGAAVMVNNDRIAGNTAQLALVQRES